VNDIIIQSRQNPKIKFLAGLRKKRDRDQHACFLVEGSKELENYLASGRPLPEFFHCPDIHKGSRPAFLQKVRDSATTTYELSPHAFEKVSGRENPDGWLGLAPIQDTALETLRLSAKPLLLVLEGTEKPGNLGAMLRTANAFGVDAVICNDPLVDLYNPNVIRTSRGLLFSMQVATAGAKETAGFLQGHNIPAAATVCEGGQPLWDQDLSGPLALVMGNEALGLGEFWQEQATLQLSIPAPGSADSLNLSTATSICLYEALRQRGL
jgi:TrmH family RNA methyltransferase